MSYDPDTQSKNTSSSNVPKGNQQAGQSSQQSKFVQSKKQLHNNQNLSLTGLSGANYQANRRPVKSAVKRYDNNLIAKNSGLQGSKL